ncbi:MAG: hypothetical protein AB9891_20060 [Anaerolineaceae bacterium]
MNNEVFRMTKEALINSLENCKYDLNIIRPMKPRGGFFTNFRDLDRSKKLTERIIFWWKQFADIGKQVIPENRNEIERFVEERIADQMATDAIRLINSPFSDRTNSELVKEAREAITFLKEIGAKDKVIIHEYMFKQKIGEV